MSFRCSRGWMVLALSSTACSALAATRIDRIDSFGGFSSNAYGVNASGQVVGRASDAGQTTELAFLRTAPPSGNGSLQALGTLGGPWSEAHAINNAGQITGWSPPDATAYGHAFRYANGSMIDLGTLGGATSFGAAINTHGHVAGYSSLPASFYTRAFRHDNGIMRDLGTLPGGAQCAATGINDAGVVVGWSDSAAGQRAFRYTGTPGAGGSMQSLGTLGGNVSEAAAINNAGQIVGKSRVATGQDHAFLYTGGTMHDLGTLSSHQSHARAINNHGDVVGTFGDLAFLYVGTPGVDGQMINLDAWLNTANPVEGAKWRLNTANAISDTGYVAGFGNYNDGAGGLRDGQFAFLLDVIHLTGTPGDASRDGRVNFDDLLTLAQHYNTSGTDWNRGDFNNDAVTGFDDLLLLAQHYGDGVSGLTGGSVGGTTSGSPDDTSDSFHADWTLARSMVPEPMSASLLLLAATARRRGR